MRDVVIAPDIAPPVGRGVCSDWMRMALLCPAALASLTIAGGVPLAVAGASSTAATVLVVSSTSDAVNGDVSSSSALVAHPGSDGISLREAITAADRSSGTQVITFAPALAGKTIAPTRPVPAITHDNTSVIGLTTADGQPAVSLDAGRVGHPALLIVAASGIAIEHLRIVDVRVPGSDGITVWAGWPDKKHPGELHLHDVRIDSNILDNTGVASGQQIALQIGTPDGEKGLPTGASLANITVAHNLILGFNGDGTLVGLDGTKGSITGLSFEENTYRDGTGAMDPALEIASFSANTITGTRIIGNTFTNNANGIWIEGGFGSASSNTVSGTVIAQNILDRTALVVSAGAGSATGNTVVNTEISNNVVTGYPQSYASIWVVGGGDSATGNRVTDLRFINDTVAFNNGGLVIDNGSPGNQVSGVVTQNSIFWANLGGVTGSGAASFSAAAQSSLIGVDPHFISAQDLHLQAGSPAIDAGTASGTPAADLENGVRIGAPDIGAYEFGATPRPTLDVLVDQVGGAGTVASTPSGITCQTSCQSAFDENTQITLLATASKGSRFTGWSGACTGSGSCTLDLSAAASVVATFAAAPVPKCKKGQKSTRAHPCRKT